MDKVDNNFLNYFIDISDMFFIIRMNNLYDIRHNLEMYYKSHC